VRFFTTLREITGKKEETLEFPKGRNITIKMVLEHLANRYGQTFTEYAFDEKTREVRGFLQFLVNGRSASSFSGLDTKLADGDVLAIIPPVGGG
jgi:molybdopterin synthase sulfur carrier subunit